MPKSVDTIVDELNDRLRQSGKPSGSMNWPDFYTMCGMQRFKSPRPEQIREKAKSKYGLVVGYGDAVVTVAHDRNFDPL